MDATVCSRLFWTQLKGDLSLCALIQGWLIHVYIIYIFRSLRWRYIIEYKMYLIPFWQVYFAKKGKRKSQYVGSRSCDLWDTNITPYQLIYIARTTSGNGFSLVYDPFMRPLGEDGSNRGPVCVKYTAQRHVFLKKQVVK